MPVPTLLPAPVTWTGPELVGFGGVAPTEVAEAVPVATGAVGVGGEAGTAVLDTTGMVTVPLVETVQDEVEVPMVIGMTVGAGQ